jgi:hypothetical protein
MIAVMTRTRTCPDCGSDIAEVETFHGSRIEIDTYPYPAGNVILIDRGSDLRAYIAHAAQIDVLALARPRYRIHRCRSTQA